MSVHETILYKNVRCLKQNSLLLLTSWLKTNKILYNTISWRTISYIRNHPHFKDSDIRNYYLTAALNNGITFKQRKRILSWLKEGEPYSILKE